MTSNAFACALREYALYNGSLFHIPSYSQHLLSTGNTNLYKKDIKLFPKRPQRKGGHNLGRLTSAFAFGFSRKCHTLQWGLVGEEGYGQ